METRKLIIITIIAAVVLNLLNEEISKNSGKSPTKDTVVEKPSEPEKPAEQPSEEEQLKKILADKVSVDIGNTPVRGNKDAKIQIVVFSDFQCPFSKRGAETVQALKQKYGNDLMFVHKNLPLGFHNEAMPAAKAALAAGRQGKFYEYHDKLYENQASISEQTYLQIAKDLGLNITKFNADRNSKEIEDEVKADLAQATKLGFNGTPGFSINGVKVFGAYSQEHFEKIIKGLGLS